MKAPFNGYFAAILFLVILLGACTRDRLVVDPRDEVVGTYTTQGSLFMPLSLELEVSKHPTKEDRILLVFKGVGYELYAEELVQTPEGISFTIPSQLSYFSGLPLITAGEERVQMGDSQHQGAYFRNNENLQIGLKATLMNTAGEESGTFSTLIKGEKDN